MKITLALPAIASEGQQPHHFLTTYLINDSVAIDAGSLGFLADLNLQQHIKHLLISHTHIDHIASLPVFLENVVDSGSEPVTIHATAPVLECLQKDVFNDRIWPDFFALRRDGKPFVQLSTIKPGQELGLDGLRITPVPVNHVVPTSGFIVDDGAAAAVIPSDTGPTEEIWQRANALPHLKAVFLEAAFPNALSRLAEISKHLTPATFDLEIRKLKKNVKAVALHLKARMYAEVAKELLALGLPGFELAKYGQAYQL